MNLYEACIALELWYIAKARAEVWILSKYANEKSLIEMRNIAKDKFKELALVHHPDKGGNSEDYIRIREAFGLVQNAQLSDYFNSLEDEKKANIKYFNPGSDECHSCRKWSDIVGTCITATCSGLEKTESVPSFAC